MRKKIKDAVLLVGNDINNATPGYAWKDLLEDLMGFLELKHERSMENKPFPLFYEEIFLAAAKKGTVDEYKVKKFIAEEVMQIEPGNIHNSIMEMGCENILTTNYDFTFEKLSSKKQFPNRGLIKESLYNLFRYHDLGEHKLWHIHGSAGAPRSVILGYEHYSGYLHFIRNYVVTGTKETYKNHEFEPLIKKTFVKKPSSDSWLDFFFSRDIFILGLNLDFVEMHLWWLLTFRARAIYKEGLSINNRIVYFYPRRFRKAIKHKLDMFDSTAVEAVPITMQAENREHYYQQILDFIKLATDN